MQGSSNSHIHQKNIEIIWKIIDSIELTVAKIINLIKVENNIFYDLLFEVFKDDNDTYLNWVNIENKEEQKEKIKNIMPLIFEKNINFQKLSNLFPSEIEPFFIYQMAINYVLTLIIKLEILKYQENENGSESFDILNFIPMLQNYLQGISILFGLFHQNSKNKKISKNNSIQSKGGKARSEKSQKIKKILYKRFEEGNYHSYAKCAEHLHLELGVACSTITKWLSQKYSKKKA